MKVLKNNTQSDIALKLANAAFQKINVDTFEGTIPTGKDLVVAEEGDEVDTAMILYGFDEVGSLDEAFTNPVYGFLTN